MSIYYQGPTHTVTDHDGGLWRIIADDPHFMTYFDDDWEAIDETNWDALLDDIRSGADQFGTVKLHRTRIPGGYAEQVWLVIESDELPDIGTQDPEAFTQFDALLLSYPSYLGGWPFTDPQPHDIPQSHLLLVRVDSTADEVWHQVSKSLSDYLLLDESAYSERNWEAWQKCLTDWIPIDVRRELVAGHGIDDDDRLDALLDLIPEACSQLHYWSGFTGEYGPSLAVLVLQIEADTMTYGKDNTK